MGTAVYTSNFTPPTSPLTAITNTKLLCCQDADPTVDNSGTSKTLTVTAANTYTQQLSPFDYDWYDDHSGQDNHFHADNITVNEVRLDTPTNNHCTVNALDGSGNLTIKQGNTKFHSSDTNRVCIKGTMGVTSGKWYYEYTDAATSSGSVGVVNASATSLTSNGMVGNSSYGWAVNNDGAKENGNSETASYMASFTTNDVIGVALNMDDGEITFYKNGSSAGVAFNNLSGKGAIFPAVCTGSHSGNFDTLNFGQMDFEHTPPSGYKAWNTSNLPTPTIKNPTEHFVTTLWSGNDASSPYGNQTVDTGMQVDMTWQKTRSVAVDPRILDRVRTLNGNSNTGHIFSNLDDAEDNADSNIDSWTSTGFVVKGNSNRADGGARTYVSWNWKANGTGGANSDGAQATVVSANQDSGFSIVTGTGTGSSTTYGHGLGVEPKVIIIKSRSGADDWYFFTSSIDGIPYNTWQYSKVNTTNAFASTTEIANNTTTFSTSYGNGTTFVSYCFAEVEGFSQFGIYEGNASAAGPFRNCGFKPAWIMFRPVASGNYWLVIDNKRDPYNDDAPQRVYWNVTDTESTYSQTKVDLLSNGFKMNGTYGDTNPSGGIVFYMAFAESPFKYANAR